jgi:hypothetical protein
MKKLLTKLFALTMLTTALNAGGISFGFSLGFGCPQVVYVHPAPVIYSQPAVVYAPAPVVYVAPPVVYVHPAPVVYVPRPVVYQSYWHGHPHYGHPHHR